MTAPVAPRVSGFERFLWFAVALVIAGVWLFFEAIAGYEIPSRAHPVLALLVLAALLQGGVDMSRVWRYRRLVDGSIPLPAEERRDLAARIARLEVSEPELIAAIQELRSNTPKKARTRRQATVTAAIKDNDARQSE